MSFSPHPDTEGAKEKAKFYVLGGNGKAVVGTGLVAEHYEGLPPPVKAVNISDKVISFPAGLSGFADSPGRAHAAPGGTKVNTNNGSTRITTAEILPLFLDGEEDIKKVEMVTPEELASILGRVTFAGDPREMRRAIEPSNMQMLGFLVKNCPEFVICKEFRDRGWLKNKEAGDAYFAAQRAKADKADTESEKRFYFMMQQIAEEMNIATNVLYPQSQDKELKCLDICMAPGGYTATVLKHHKNAKCFGITLPAKDGGHTGCLQEKKANFEGLTIVHVPSSQLAGLKKLDVTMLVNEFMDTGPIAVSHPAVAKFENVRPFSHHKFDLVFCDGIVLRTQEREGWREENEVTRLSRAQMILALQRIAPGGTVVMLLHKVDSWGSASILYTFSKFSKVETFKPVRKHSSRSSFYMIAKHVQPNKKEAKTAVMEWKESWRRATLGGEDGSGEKKSDDPESVVREMLENYGGRLIEIGRPIWEIQANALSKTSYAGDGSGSTYSPRSVSMSSPYTPRFSSADSPLSKFANTHSSRESQGLKSPIWSRNRRASIASDKGKNSPKPKTTGHARQVSMTSNEETNPPTDLVWGRPRQGNNAIRGKRGYENAPPGGLKFGYVSPRGGPHDFDIPPASPTPKRPFSGGSFYDNK